MTILRRALAKRSCESIEVTVRRRSVLFGSFVARMRGESLRRRVMPWETVSGKGHTFGHKKDYMRGLEMGLETLGVKSQGWCKIGRRFQGVGNEAEACMQNFMLRKISIQKSDTRHGYNCNTNR